MNNSLFSLYIYMEQNSQGFVYCLWWNSVNIDEETRNNVK